MHLNGVGLNSLPPAARAAFESATEKFYRKRILSSIEPSSVQRRLQDMTSFDTNVTVTGEQPDSTGNTVIYDQVLHLTTAEGTIDEAAARNEILSPLSTDDGKQEYLAFLRNSSQSFEGVTSVDPPLVPGSDRSTDAGSDEDSGGISTLVFIVVIIFGSLCFCCCLCAAISLLFLRGGGNNKKSAAEDDPGAMGGADEDYGGGGGGGYDTYDTPGIGLVVALCC